MAEKRAEDASAKVFEGIARLGAAGAFDVGGGVVPTDEDEKEVKGQEGSRGEGEVS